MKGVQPEVLDPGTYYLNPYMVSVVEVNLQSQRFEMSGEDAISFLTLDGFTVTVEGTIEYRADRGTGGAADAPGGRHGGHPQEDHPAAGARIQPHRGQQATRRTTTSSAKRARSSRTTWRRICSEQCEAWGVDIKSVLIRNITPPDEIASIIRDREVAVQDAQEVRAADRAGEVEGRTGASRRCWRVQNKEKVEADTRADPRGDRRGAGPGGAADRAPTATWRWRRWTTRPPAFQAEAKLLKAEGGTRRDPHAQRGGGRRDRRPGEGVRHGHEPGAVHLLRADRAAASQSILSGDRGRRAGRACFTPVPAGGERRCAMKSMLSKCR